MFKVRDVIQQTSIESYCAYGIGLDLMIYQIRSAPYFIACCLKLVRCSTICGSHGTLIKNLTILPPIALAHIQPVAKYMLHLPCMSAKMVECPAGRAAVTLANGLETPSLQEPRDFEEAHIEWKIS